mgnify:CR=1 FL=1
MAAIDADQDTVHKADGIQDLRQNRHRLTGHIVERPWQRTGIGAAIARAGIGKHATSRFGEELLWKIPPEIDAAKTLMKQHKGRRLSRARPDRISLQQHVADPHLTGRASVIPAILQAVRHGLI